MSDVASRVRPTYSLRLFRAFAEVLQEKGLLGGPAAELAGLAGERILVEVAHEALAAAISLTGDPDLGLKAARRLVLGDVGTVDYVVGSAPTVRHAVEQASRYLRLINDAVEVRLDVEGRLATLRLDNSVVLPRAAADFEVAGFYRNHVLMWFEQQLSEVTVLFTHQRPENTTEYELTFGPAVVRFGAPYQGFSFDRSFLELPLGRADPNLQRVVIPYANLTLERLSVAHSVTESVRKFVEQQLAAGIPDVADVASALGMSTRTLARRLESEGTSFREVIDDLRRRLALESVGQRDLPFSEIADQLGFSHAAAFHRAFRRWTGQTPLKHRRAQGR